MYCATQSARSRSGSGVSRHGRHCACLPCSISPARLVYTEIFDVPPFNEPGSAAINTITYEDLGGRTKVVARSRFPSVESLDGALSTGMIGGALEVYDRLGELIDEAAAA